MKTYLLMLCLFSCLAQAQTSLDDENPPEKDELWHQLASSIVNALDDTPTGLSVSATRETHLKLFPLKEPKLFEKLFANAQGMDGFFIEEFELPVGRVINLIYDESTWRRFGVGLLYQQGTWHRFYLAGVSSKSFTPMFDVTQVGTNTIDAVVCIKDCSWWGKNIRVRVDLELRKVHFVEEAETDYLSWVTEQ
ncbi:hypothetical protein [Shewanella litorisediminis]|uniref:Uncharacterized protein n=1 Tax=Shewanella litorisediminis TaxID=1173586 RepID=A0ABX7G579_9GAMM|nr:hypothetical protein [Shewanella litorisediminis]MCL2920230.1 hypothetical protein [Shewanella litorisediminis]QRH02504.1 hypothetical protein JQC75_03515 [Shewanella litorisediminis]